MGTSPDPLSIECPLCGAAPGAECSGTVGDDLWHIARDEAWRERGLPFEDLSDAQIVRGGSEHQVVSR